MREGGKGAGGLLARTLIGAAALWALPVHAQFFVPEAGSIGPGSFPSERASAAAAANGGTAPPASTSPVVRLNPQGFLVGAPLDEPSDDPRRIRITPSLGGQVLATDNVFQTARNRKADVITTITPGLFVNADTPRLTALFNYQPNALFYAQNSALNRIDHNGSGQLLATLIPEHFFVDVRGFAAVQPLVGAQPSGSGTVTNSSNVVQTVSYLVSPYYVQRFGTLMTARIGYTLQYSNQSIPDSQAGRLAGTGVNAAQAGFRNNEFTAHQVYGILRSGPDFGPFAFQGVLDSTNYVGNGVLDGAYRRIASLEGRYAFTREFSLLLEGGYEQQRYAGTPGFRVDGPIYSAGARYDFSAQSFVIARYGRRDGFNSVSLDASVAVGGRTRLVARYGERLTTSATRAVDLLTTTTLDELGNPIDLATGLPANTTSSGSPLGLQSGLYRVRSGVASVAQSWPRDTFSLNVSYEERTPVSLVAGTVANAQKAFAGSAVWGHSLTERTVGTAFVQVGRLNSGLVGNGTFGSASVSIQHQLQPRLAGTVQFATTVRNTDQVSGRVVQNLVLIGLRQIF